jgi:hypothetical protein
MQEKTLRISVGGTILSLALATTASDEAKFEVLNRSIAVRAVQSHVNQSLSSWRGYVNQRSEQAVLLVAWSSGKEQRIHRSVGTGAMTKLKCPKAIDLDRLS